ncbi:MAG: SseB family protein [Paracoccaceae bacterium]
MTDTLLDAAQARTEAAPDDTSARMAYYAQLAGSELFLLLASDPQGDALEPRIFDTGDARLALVFDTEARLADFAGGVAPYAAVSGRVLVHMMAAQTPDTGGQGIGLGINLNTDYAFVMDGAAVDWLAGTLAQTPDEAEARPTDLFPLSGLPEHVVTALDSRLAAAQGLARAAYLAAVHYDDGSRGHMLGITGAQPGSEGALAQVVNEALIFSGIEAGALDVVFVADSDGFAARLARVGLRFDLPQPKVPNARPAPGSDPDKPPILR